MEKQTMNARGLSNRRRKAAARRAGGTVRLLAFGAVTLAVISLAAYFL